MNEISISATGDGCEALVKVLNRMFGILRIALPPSIFILAFLTNNGIAVVGFELVTKLFVEPFGLGPRLSPVLTNTYLAAALLIGTASALNGLFNVFLYLNWALMYLNTTQLWMKKFRCVI